MKYKILLIDDQFEDESIKDFMLNASLENIEIHAVKFHEEGINLLLNDSDFKYQAVILDATGYKSNGETELTNTGLTYSLLKLKEFRKSNIVPWFVYTGAGRNKNKTEFSNDIKLFQEDIKFGRKDKVYYVKTEDDDILLQDIKTEIDNLENSQIQLQHKHVFQIAKKINVPHEDINNLVKIFKSIQSYVNDIEPSLYFTQLRKYIEYVFRDAAKYNILHEKCINENGQVNLTESSLFLAGEKTKHLKVYCDKSHFSKIMAENIKNLIFITGAASHTSDVNPAENMNYQEFRKSIKTPYLLYQLTFIICDLLVWYDNYIKENYDLEMNKKLWISIEDNNSNISETNQIGQLQQDEEGYYFIDKCIFQYTKVHNIYNIGDKLEITKTIENDKPTKSKYPFFVISFKKT